MAVHHPGDLNQEMGQILRQQRQLGKQSPMASSSVTRGRFRVASKEGLVAESVPGGEPAISVKGRQSVSGRLDGDGTLFWDGDAEFTNNTTVGGDFVVDAETLLRGLVSLLASMTVKPGGDITVEGTNPIRLGHVSGLPAIEVGNAAQIIGASDGVSVTGGLSFLSILSAGIEASCSGSKVILDSTQARLERGTRYLRVTNGGISGNLPTVTRANSNNAVIGTMWSDTAGNWHRVIA